MQYHYVSWNEYDRDVRVLAKKIKRDIEKFDFIRGIPCGGLILAVHLHHLLKIKYTTRKTEKNSRILVVDDVSDTGSTLLNEKVNHECAATLYRKDGTKFEPKYVARTINRYIIYPWEV